MKTFYFVREKHLEISYLKMREEIDQGITIEDAIVGDMFQQAGKEREGEYFLLLATTDKHIADKALKEYQNECRYDPLKQTYCIVCAEYDLFEFKIEDVLDQDDQKRLASFSGTTTEVTEIEEIYKTIGRLLQTDIISDVYFLYDEDFSRQKLRDLK